MIDALIKRVSVTYKCYEMYAHRGEKVQLARVLRSMKKWTPLFTELAESSLNQYNNALISFFL
jgi:hypothetical protein